MFVPEQPEDRHAQEGRARLAAQALYNRARFGGWWRGVWARWRGRSRELRFLGAAVGPDAVSAHHPLPVSPVRLSAIQGSQGKPGSFDCEWYPLDRTTADRWISVATAMLQDVRTLGPVDLIRVGETPIYYVSDGHHRVSVAWRLGYLYMDAQVIVWELATGAANDSPD